MVAQNTPGPSDGSIGGLEGRVLAGRYRVVNVVSAGANTIIADAFDVSADRPVTLKIVRPELSSSEEFRRDFRRAAEVATALSHPNIAAVLDWGEVELDDVSTVFWVVEYLSGGSLRDLFDRGRLLESSQALVVGLEACRALDAAHQRGIAHTELTPSKLVFGSDRRLRIIDFGMAQLLGREAWAEPATVATHVARYAAPEQALGLPVTDKTDVYALALSLLEAVTGTVPFAADSTVSTLAARVGKLMPVSADLGSLAAVLERAGRPEPDDRSTAAEFGRSLVQAAERLPRPEPIPIVAAGLFDTADLQRPVAATGDVAEAADEPDPPAAAPDEAEAGAVASAGADTAGTGEPHDAESAQAGPSETEPVEPAPAPTEPVATTAEAAQGAAPHPAAPVSAPDAPAAADAGDAAAGDTLIILADAAEQEAVATTALPATHTAGPQAAATEQMPVTAPFAAPTGAPVGRRRRGELYDDQRPQRRTAAIVALSLFVLAGLAAVAFAAFWLVRTKTYEVPDLVGVDEAVALNEVSGNGWEIIRETERSDEQPVVGAVIRTFPAAGAVLEEGAEFRMFVSEGPLFRVLPDVGGLTVAEAQERLEALQLSSFVDGESFDEEVPAGTVIAWVVRGDASKGAGDEVLPGTTIALTVSKGPAPRVVPDVVGLTLDEAVAAAADVRLNVVGGGEEFSDDVAEGIIISQEIAPGEELERDGTFTVVVSKGRDLIALPDLEGLNFTAAQAALTDAGFTIGSLLGTTEGVFQSISIETEPVDDTGLYPRGTPVDLIFL